MHCPMVAGRLTSKIPGKQLAESLRLHIDLKLKCVYVPRQVGICAKHSYFGAQSKDCATNSNSAHLDLSMNLVFRGTPWFFLGQL